ncbi:YqaJ viral recombinase family protein [Paracoccus fontiphilus]|uniref:YqaJ viral recombinase family protein n=1 Tax=Paracoccus fontiphilus TaxID=1815556 RepID=A0ABV7IF63_9RHOB|nr:YqaJ viral recombinase family protein [Paracoccus fontiphilus]
MNQITRSEFLTRRRHGIGGSDIAAIVGLSKFATPYDVWLSKRGEAVEEDGDKPWLYWGSILEDVVAREYALRTGAKVQRVNAQLIHPEHHFAMANIDRAVVNPDIRGNVRWIDGRLTTDRILECKTANGFAASVWGADGTDEVPESYLCQVQWYMGITGARYADLAVLIGGSDYRSYTIEAHPELFADLLTEAAAFWKLVEDGIAPDPQTVADAQSRWSQHVKAKTHMASGAAARAVDDLAEVKEQMADLKRREDELKLVIMADMQDAEVLTDMGEPIATWKTQTAERIDTKALRKDHPEIAALYSTESTTRVLRLKSKKD